MAYNGIDDWTSIFEPMKLALDGDPDPIRFDEDWAEEPDQLDPWADARTFGEVKPDQPKPEPLRDITRIQQQEQTARLGPHPRSVLSPQSPFNLAAWEKSVVNGQIPSSALARVAGEGFLMEAHAAAAAAAMIQAARRDGVVLTIGNTYRDKQAQQRMYDAYRQGDGNLAAAPGTSKHGLGLAIDFNITRQNHAWLAANGGKFGYTNPFGSGYDAQENWHWEYGQGGNAPNFAGKTNDPRLGAPKFKTVRRPVDQDPAAAPMGLTGEYGDASFGTVLADVLAGDVVEISRKVKAPAMKGKDSAIKRQLYRGFVDAGREDLARMVGTKDFATWIGQESGWRTGATSPANNNGMANDGLFQIWRGHSFNSNGQVAQMSPYEQAQLVAKYFDHLGPDDIRRYAQQIRSGQYSGWG